MKLRLGILALAAAASGWAQVSSAPPKVALINLEQAMVLTTDGQTAEKKLDAQFAPRKAAIEEKHKELMALQDKMDKGGLSEEDSRKLSSEIEQKSDAADQETTQADADLEQAQQQVLDELGPKLMAVVVRYAKLHGYDVVFDTSSSDMPRMYTENSTDITKQVVEEYERSSKPAPPARKK